MVGALQDVIDKVMNMQQVLGTAPVHIMVVLPGSRNQGSTIEFSIGSFSDVMHAVYYRKFGYGIFTVYGHVPPK